MKKLIIPLICLGIILFTLININVISTFLANTLTNTITAKIDIKNEYYKDSDFEYVKNVNNFSPYGKQDIINIVYTMINSGIKNFTFYCPKEYKDCIKDVNNFTKDSNLLTHINNFVHPFNSIDNIITTISDLGEINLKATYLYTEEEKIKISQEVAMIINDLKKDIDNEEDNSDIRLVHDYIINNTSYNIDSKDRSSYLAYGPLFNHLATCNGYTDLMAIFLTKLGYENFKIATTGDEANQNGHIWNAVKINDVWYHLDLTWDDPVDEKANHLYHKYFLLTTEQLITADNNITSKDHDFDRAIYTELKNANLN